MKKSKKLKRKSLKQLGLMSILSSFEGLELDSSFEDFCNEAFVFSLQVGFDYEFLGQTFSAVRQAADYQRSQGKQFFSVSYCLENLSELSELASFIAMIHSL